jgi:cytochrome c-type biogenesis protein CcmF
LKFESKSLIPNDTLLHKNFKIVAKELNYSPRNGEFLKHPHDAGAGVLVQVIDTQRDTSYTGEAALGLDGALLYTYPAVFEELGLRIKLDEKFAEKIFTPEEQLSYSELVFKQGDSTKFGKYVLVLKGFEKDPKNKNYEPKQGDIALSAIVEVIDKTGQISESRPIYVIRDNTPMSIKNYVANPGLHIRFSHIDPVEEIFSFKIAVDNREKIDEIPVGIADNVPRTDYVILEAKVFPGINLFWGGTILMMLGLLMAWIYRARRLGGS